MTSLMRVDRRASTAGSLVGSEYCIMLGKRWFSPYSQPKLTP